MKRRYCVIIALFCMMFVFLPAVLCGCGQKETPRDSYMIRYELNYDGGGTRSVSLPAGAHAVEWRAVRDEYDLVGWYTDPGCTTPYDFSQRVNEDKTLYAAWRVKPGMATVTFDFGVAGKENKTLAARKESTISEKYVPTYKPFGMQLVGWYKDKNKTEKWDFSTDTVKGDTTLYAGYDYTMSVDRNPDGSVRYDNVTVNVWVNSGSGLFNEVLMNTLAERFNSEFEGKIRVEISTRLVSQADTFLRLQETRQIIHTASTYYPIGEIYNFAGIAMSNSDWYEKAVREMNVDGAYVQVPLAGFVPYIVYNKALMEKYAGGALPTDYSELSALLRRAYEGEIGSCADFSSIVASESWHYKEAPSYTAFVQNGAPYYVYENNDTFNNWSDSAVMERAVRALEITYGLFGRDGECHGMTTTDAISATIARVREGRAMMGLVSWMGNEANLATYSDIGVLPLAGLMSDEKTEDSAATPVYTIGLGFYNGATNVIADPVKVCASAVFADWLSRNAYEFASVGYVPLHKQAVAADAFANPTDNTVKFVKTTFAYENLTTLYGHRAMKTVVNSKAAEEVIMPFLRGDGKGAGQVIADLRTKITELVY